MISTDKKRIYPNHSRILNRQMIYKCNQHIIIVYVHSAMTMKLKPYGLIIDYVQTYSSITYTFQCSNKWLLLLLSNMYIIYYAALIISEYQTSMILCCLSIIYIIIDFVPIWHWMSLFTVSLSFHARPKSIIDSCTQKCLPMISLRIAASCDVSGHRK